MKAYKVVLMVIGVGKDRSNRSEGQNKEFCVMTLHMTGFVLQISDQRIDYQLNGLGRITTFNL